MTPFLRVVVKLIYGLKAEATRTTFRMTGDIKD